jgi:hypothetical protein
VIFSASRSWTRRRGRAGRWRRASSMGSERWESEGLFGIRTAHLFQDAKRGRLGIHGAPPASSSRTPRAGPGAGHAGQECEDQVGGEHGRLRKAVSRERGSGSRGRAGVRGSCEARRIPNICSAVKRQAGPWNGPESAVGAVQNLPLWQLRGVSERLDGRRIRCPGAALVGPRRPPGVQSRAGARTQSGDRWPTSVRGVHEPQECHARAAARRVGRLKRPCHPERSEGSAPVAPGLADSSVAGATPSGFSGNPHQIPCGRPLAQ